MKIANDMILGSSIAETITPQLDKNNGERFLKEFENAKSKDQQKLYESCQALEGVFLNKVFESMRSTIPQGGLFEKSFATDTFESMLYEEYSTQISKNGSLGIADILYNQLSAQLQIPSINKETKNGIVEK